MVSVRVVVFRNLNFLVLNNMRKHSLVVLISLVALAVGQAYAAPLDGDVVLERIVTEIFNPLYRAAVGVSFVYFMYGVVKYLRDLRNPQDKNTGKQHLLWGMVGLFIIFSVGGIINFLGSFGQLGVN